MTSFWDNSILEHTHTKSRLYKFEYVVILLMNLKRFTFFLYIEYTISRATFVLPWELCQIDERLIENASYSCCCCHIIECWSMNL